VLHVSKFPRVRLAFASCTFVVVMTYAAWQNQQHAREVLEPAAGATMELASGPRPEAVPASAMDPQPGWIGATVPQLPPALVRSEEEAAPEARTKPEFQEPASTQVTALAQPKPELTAAKPELTAAKSSAELTPIPLPRPRPRRPTVTTDGAPLKLH
jgi:hypothetical protein